MSTTPSSSVGPRSSGPRSSPSILWVQVCGLAAVQGAIALTWVIYNLYLKDLLVALDFPASLAASLLILENVLAALMEPVMGGFSDTVQRWVGSRFPFIAVGILAASAAFIGIPVALLWGVNSPAVRWLLPVILVSWALAMTVFRSPALSLLGRYAFTSGLPQAASILTLVGGVAGAMGPLASGVILGVGPVFAFGLGSVVLLAAAAALRWVDPNRSITEAGAMAPDLDPADVSPASVAATASGTADNLAAAPDPQATPAAPEPTPNTLSIPRLAIIFITGLGIALGFRLLMVNFPQIITTNLPDSQPKLIMGGIFIALAVTAIPAGWVALRLGNRKTMMLGLVGMALFCLGTRWVNSPEIAVLLSILLGSAFSLVSNGTIPFALALVPPQRGGLGTGIFFSGGAVAASLFGAFLGPDMLTPALATSVGAGSFLGASCLVALAKAP